MWHQGLVSLGKQLPPKPRPACRNFAADAAVQAHRLGDLETSAPTRSASNAISLMKLILVARKLLQAYLISSAVSMRRNPDDRGVEQEQRPVDLAHQVLGAPPSRCRSRRGRAA
jgi:hypothetical protein